MNQVLINGQWKAANQTGEFTAFNPTTAQPLEQKFPISSWEDCDAVLNAASAAAEQLELVPGEQIAEFLDRYADRLAEAAEEICTLAATETGLPLAPRLMDVEMPRTQGQLRQAAEAARSQSWRRPVVDASANLYSCFGPIGPTLIFGPNNFPLAFNAISGGDFVAAIAAGNPVIAKAHSAHPGTSLLLAQQAQAAAEDAGLPAGTVQMLFGLSRTDGLRMVADPRLGAAAFTGSRTAGVALKAAADAVGTPIYLEMSSVNPVFFLPGALDERGKDLALEMAGSCLLGAGQFCTCPNMFVLVASEAANQFMSTVKDEIQSRPLGTLLSQGTVAGLSSALTTLTKAGAEILTGGKEDNEAGGYRHQNTLLQVSGEQFLAAPELLQTEAFGPASLAVIAKDEAEALAIARQIEGSLTACVYTHSEKVDDKLCQQLMQILRRKAGRLLNDKMPTGVAVSPAMNHGGPFPATGHPGFTAVGLPASISRFAKLDCYDNVRPERLPECLRNL